MFHSVHGRWNAEQYIEIRDVKPVSLSSIHDVVLCTYIETHVSADQRKDRLSTVSFLIYYTQLHHSSRLYAGGLCSVANRETEVSVATCA